jgi:tight adherence protein C
MRGFLLTAAGFLLLMLMVSGSLLLQDVRRAETLASRIRIIHGETPATRALGQRVAVRGLLTRFISGIGTGLLRSGLIPMGTRAELTAMLASAGLRGTQGLHVFLGSKILTPMIMVLVGWVLSSRFDFLSSLNVIVLPAFGVIGLILPDWVIGKRRKRYLTRIEAGLPDALDMMVICTQSGLGLGASVVRVADELRHTYRDLALEFSLTANELQIATDSRSALANLGSRTGIESFRRFAATMIQTIQYGTPVTEALRVLSIELRNEMLIKFEERAARLPVLLTLPMIVFILPCVFIIAGAPAMLTVSRAFDGG